MAPRAKGVWGVEWDTCDRCGFVWPINLLTMQLGRKVCPYDVDDLSNFYRSKIKADIMRTPEGQSDKPFVFRAPVEITF